MSRPDAVGAALSSAVASGCGSSPMATTVSQRDPGVLDSDGRPLTAPEQLVILGGGDGPHRAVRYLLSADTPVIWSGVSPATFTERATGRTLVMGPTSLDHDYALLMVVAEPIGQTLALSAQGIAVNGTVAASYWFETEIAPSIATTAFGWVLVEWTNEDADPSPSPGDTFVVLGSG